jgi:hypothetical protein
MRWHTLKGIIEPAPLKNTREIWTNEHGMKFTLDRSLKHGNTSIGFIK